MNATEWFTKTNGLTKISGFGPRTHPVTKVKGHHNGNDYGGKGVRGKPVLCPSDGIVTSSGVDAKGYGQYVGVTIPSKHVLVFAHLDKRSVKKGQKIQRGDFIGILGNTGVSTGPHLHFQVNKPGGGTRGKNYWGDPDEFDFGGDDEVRIHCVVGFSETDAPTILPVVQILRKKDDCPIYYRNTMTKALAKYQTIYMVGGSEKEIRELAPDAKIIPITGPTRLETAVAAWDWCLKNK